MMYADDLLECRNESHVFRVKVQDSHLKDEIPECRPFEVGYEGVIYGTVCFVNNIGLSIYLNDVVSEVDVVFLWEEILDMA